MQIMTTYIADVAGWLVTRMHCGGTAGPFELPFGTVVSPILLAGGRNPSNRGTLCRSHNLAKLPGFLVNACTVSL